MDKEVPECVSGCQHNSKLMLTFKESLMMPVMPRYENNSHTLTLTKLNRYQYSNWGHLIIFTESTILFVILHIILLEFLSIILQIMIIMTSLQE